MVESIQFVLEASHRRWERVFESDLSTRSQSGIEYAAAVIYADYLGLRVVGRIPPWIRRLRHFPKSVPPNLRDGVTRVLSMQNLHLTDEGQLVACHQPVSL